MAALGERQRPLRVLMLGPLNHVHVEHLAVAVREQGYDVVVGGESWGAGQDSILSDYGIPVHVRTWPTARWMRRLLRETRPDVVHAHWMPIAEQALLYGARPLIATAWGSDVFLAGRRQRATYRLLIRHADILMADSAALAAALKNLGAPADRTMVLGWGVDLKAFSPATVHRSETRQALGLPPGPVILSPRWLRDLYNPQVILRAFERVAAERDDVTLVLKHLGRRRLIWARSAIRSECGSSAMSTTIRWPSITEPPTCASRSRAATPHHGRSGKRWAAVRHASSPTCRGFTNSSETDSKRSWCRSARRPWRTPYDASCPITISQTGWPTRGVAWLRSIVMQRRSSHDCVPSTSDWRTGPRNTV